MTQEATVPFELGSDLPLVNPADDAFGYAGFASQLADAIMRNASPQGLVLAVHGQWGSGKSSLLNFIKHDLRALPEDRRPVTIDFNPWWFEGREQIASQLLGQFSAQLPDRLKHARTVAKLVGKYSEQIATAAADYSGFGWAKGPVAWVLGMIPSLKSMTEPSGIPQIKKKVADAINNTGKRFVFFVDDIDRLTPDEARDLFRAIKALADFPEVVYVLFFDRAEVGRALSASLKIDGEAYLEKIVQAPFHLPAVNKTLLQQKLFKGLDAILDSRPMPMPFDKNRWGEILWNGLDRFIRKPRDIVRVHNALSVTYPPVAGEVNAVDFIALEFLRVFEPGVYAGIRDDKELFCGVNTWTHNKDSARAFMEKWRDALPEPSRDWLVAVVGSLFPRVAEALGSHHFTGGDRSEWRRELRVCSPDCFDVYFQFAVPAGQVSKAELDALIAQESPDAMVATLLAAKNVVHADGHTKARDLLERLRDFDQIEPAQAEKLVEAIIATSPTLLANEDERGIVALPNRWRILGLVADLLERLPRTERQAVLLRLAGDSPALHSVVGLADMALRAKRDPSKAHKAMLDLDDDFADALAGKVGARLNASSLEALLASPEMDFVVHRWSQWGDESLIPPVFEPMLADDGRLLALIDKFVRTGQIHSGRETTETYHVSMTALGKAVDIASIEPRVRALQSRSDLTRRQRAALRRVLKGLERIAAGQDPDDYFDSDDDSASS